MQPHVPVYVDGHTCTCMHAHTRTQTQILFPNQIPLVSFVCWTQVAVRMLSMGWVYLFILWISVVRTLLMLGRSLSCIFMNTSWSAGHHLKMSRDRWTYMARSCPRRAYGSYTRFMTESSTACSNWLDLQKSSYLCMPFVNQNCNHYKRNSLLSTHGSYGTHNCCMTFQGKCG